MATQKQSRKNVLIYLVLLLVTIFIGVALLVWFVQYDKRNREAFTEAAYEATSYNGIVDSVMTDRTDDNKMALDRYIIVLYDISQKGIYHPDLTPELNRLLVSLLFDTSAQFENAISEDSAATRLINKYRRLPLIPDEKTQRVGLSVVYTGLLTGLKDRLTREANLKLLEFDEYANAFITGFFSARERADWTNVQLPASTIRTLVERELPSQMREFRGDILSLPTFAKPLSARAARQDYFARETLIIRVSDRFSGNIHERLSVEDQKHVAYDYQSDFETGPLTEVISHISQTKLHIKHERSGDHAVHIELFRLEPDIEAKTTVALRKRSNGYEVPQADPSVPEDSGFRLVWSERRPAVEYAGELYELRGRLSRGGSRIPFSSLPNPYWNYKFRELNFTAGHLNAESKFKLAFPILAVTERESQTPIVGKRPPGVPVFAILGLVVATLLLVALGRWLFLRTLEELGRPWMEITDDSLNPREYPCTNTLYRDIVDNRVVGHTMIIHSRATEHNVNFFIRNTGGGALQVELVFGESRAGVAPPENAAADGILRLDSGSDNSSRLNDDWQLELEAQSLKIESEAEVWIKVRAPSHGGNVRKTLIVTPRNTEQSPVTLTLDLRRVEPTEIIDTPIGVDFGTVGSCVAVYSGSPRFLKNDDVLPILPAEPGLVQSIDQTDHEDSNNRILKTVINTDTYEDRGGRDFKDLKLAGAAWEANPNTYFPNFKRFLDEATYWDYEARWSQGQAQARVKPEDAVARVLLRLLKEARRHIKGNSTDWAQMPVVGHLVMGVPNTVNGRALEVRRQACRLCGVERVDFIREAEAAALFYFTENLAQLGQKTLFFDFGGGTLDWAVVQGTTGTTRVQGEMVKHTELNVLDQGSHHLGGIDLDREVAQSMIDQTRTQPGLTRFENAFKELMFSYDKLLESLDAKNLATRLDNRRELKKAAEARKKNLPSAPNEASTPIEMEVSEFVRSLGLRLDPAEGALPVGVLIKIDEAKILAELEKDDKTTQEVVELMEELIDERDDLQQVVVSGRAPYLSAVRERLERACRKNERFDGYNRLGSRDKEAIALAAALYCATLKDTGQGGGPQIRRITRQRPPGFIGILHPTAQDPKQRFTPLIKPTDFLDDSGYIRRHSYLHPSGRQVQLNIAFKTPQGDEEPILLFQETVQLKEASVLKVVLELDDRQDRIKVEVYSGKRYPFVGDTRDVSLDNARLLAPFELLDVFEVGRKPYMNLPSEKKWPR